MGQTALLVNQQPGGLALLGAPVPFTTGNVYWVSSVTAAGGVDDTSHGQSPSAPFATVGYAVTQCTSDNGDIIMVMPGHAENITKAGGIAIALNGIRIIGMGRGRKRPTFTWTTITSATITSAGTNNSFENCIFDMTGFAAVVTGFNLAASDFTLDGCEVLVANATNQCGIAITTAATANRLTVQNCVFRGTADAGTSTAIKIVGGDGHLIQNNVFIGAYTTTLGAIQNVTTACTNIAVLNNRIWNRTASSAVGMTFVATNSTGIIAGNSIQVNTGTAPIVGTGMSFVGPNYYSATIATGAVLV